MDLIDRVGDIVNVQEIAIDDIGRVEVFNGRVRVTFVRMTENEHGGLDPIPHLCITMSIDAFRVIVGRRQDIDALVDAKAVSMRASEWGAARHH